MSSTVRSCALNGVSGVSIAPLFEHVDFPLLIEPTDPIADPMAWAGEHRATVSELVGKHGALLFRGFPLLGAANFEAFVNGLCPADWVEYREASTPRSHVNGHVFTSTEYYPDFRIYVHNENSHVTSWPLYVFFHCQRPAAEGGHTPVADCRGVYQRLPAHIVDRFTRTGWLYRRNFHPGSSVTWQKTFGTDHRADVEAYCRENHMVARWNGDTLTIKYRRWAALRHPLTNDMTWFNHGTFFNPHAMEPALKGAVFEMGEEKMPYHTYYGDGTPIDEATIKTLDAAYAAETVIFPWHRGDVLMLDNMRMAHGRTSFRGQREVLVAMKRRIRCSEIAAPDQYALLE